MDVMTNANDLPGQNRLGNVLLCIGRGETARPEVAIARTRTELVAFLREKVVDCEEWQKHYVCLIDEHDFTEHPKFTIEFEIGEMSFEDAYA